MMPKSGPSISLNKNAVSLAGEFAVLSQLALRGFDASLTLGHTKGVDILVSNPSTGSMAKLEVKTTLRNRPTRVRLFGYSMGWMMSDKHETINDGRLFYCFVNIEQRTNTFRFFVVPSAIVAEYVREEHRLWLSAAGSKPRASTSMRVFRIGLDSEDTYPLPTPSVTEYEDAWHLLI